MIKLMYTELISNMVDTSITSHLDLSPYLIQRWYSVIVTLPNSWLKCWIWLLLHHFRTFFVVETFGPHWLSLYGQMKHSSKHLVLCSQCFLLHNGSLQASFMRCTTRVNPDTGHYLIKGVLEIISDMVEKRCFSSQASLKRVRTVQR